MEQQNESAYCSTFIFIRQTQTVHLPDEIYMWWIQNAEK